MGNCDCKSNPQTDFKSDVAVPGIDDNNDPFGNNRESIPSCLPKQTGSRIKTFMKLKTQKEIAKVKETSTEKFLMRTKTSKGPMIVDLAENNVFYDYKTTSTKREKNTIVLSTVHESDNSNIATNNFYVSPVTRPDYEYTYSNKEVTCEEEANFLLLLKRNFLFRNFDDSMLKQIFDKAMGFQIEEGSIIFQEEDEGSCLFIIKSGKVEITMPQTSKKILGPGESFGELALMYEHARRTSTAKAITQLEFYAIEGSVYRETRKEFGRDMEIMLSYIDSISWFHHLEQSEKVSLAMSATTQEFERGEKIFSKSKQGIKDNHNSSDKIFIVIKGSLCYVNKSGIAQTFTAKDSYGEKRVILDIIDKYDHELLSTVKTECYVISRGNLEDTLGLNYKDIILQSIFRYSVTRNKYFRNLLMESHIEGLYKTMILNVYTHGQVVFSSQASKNKKAVLILEGTLANNTEVLAEKGCLFGDEIINSSHNLHSDLITNGECITLESNWDDIILFLKGISQNSSLDLFKRVIKLRKIRIFQHLSESKLLELCNIMTKHKYTPGQFIFRENTPGDEFYLIHKGRVQIIQNNKNIRELDEGNCFGEISLLNELNRSASVVAVDEVTCFTLTKEEFIQFLIDEQVNDCIKSKMCLEDNGISLYDLYYVSFLGRGRFGTVYLVHNNVSMYAVKLISRAMVEKQRSLAKYLLWEKKTLMEVDHRFVVKMVKTLKTDTTCMFLMEYVKGKNMDEYLSSRTTKRNLIETKFYSASLFLILNYLNRKLIVHRDIKPSNIMIDHNGYLRLIDFGTAKKIKDFTHTVIGTPNFMAPDVVSGKGYSFPCDYWSVGVCIYYIYYGVFPFEGKNDDVMSIYNEVVNRDLSYPTESPSMELNMFLNTLLVKKPMSRCCNLRMIQAHPFFKDFSWNDLEEMKIQAQYRPKDKREVSTNLKNYKTPFYSVIENEKGGEISGNRERETTPCDFNSKWYEEF